MLNIDKKRSGNLADSDGISARIYINRLQPSALYCE
jgi:hypothetical protein